jgi:hypothetical protein
LSFDITHDAFVIVMFALLTQTTMNYEVNLLHNMCIAGIQKLQPATKAQTTTAM